MITQEVFFIPIQETEMTVYSCMRVTELKVFLLSDYYSD